MARFQYKKKTHTYRKFVLSLCAFLLIVGIFYQGIQSVSTSTTRRQKESLENALTRSITWTRMRGRAMSCSGWMKLDGMRCAPPAENGWREPIPKAWII